MTYICSFCLSIFMEGTLCCEGDLCPHCEVGTLEDYYNYLFTRIVLRQESDDLTEGEAS